MIEQYQLKKIKISEINLDKDNPNKMTDEQLASLRYSLKKFGQLKPPVIDQTLTVCDGEHQVRAYMAEGVEEIQCLQVNCTPTQRRLIRQSMNKLHGTHDLTLDAEEYKALLENNELTELSRLLATPEQELKQLIAEIDAQNNPLLDKEEDFDTEKSLKSPKYKIELGEVWQLGQHRLMCGDSTNSENVSKLMGGGET